MSRLPDPRSDLDQALRSALHLAAESVEPGADGLDQIRAKIAARHSAGRRFWHAVNGAVSWWRRFWTRDFWQQSVIGAVIERFRPVQAGWFGWLRPVAAITTGLFVVTAASWAVAAALPAAISTVTDSHPFRTSTATPHHTKSRSQSSYTPTSGGGGVGPVPVPGGASSPSATPSCSTPSASPTSTASPTVSPSSTDSSTPPDTPPPTDSGSPTPSTSPANSGAPATPAPQTTPSIAPSTAASPQATGKALLAVYVIVPPPSSPTPVPSTPIASPTVGPPPPPSPTPVPTVPC